MPTLAIFAAEVNRKFRIGANVLRHNSALGMRRRRRRVWRCHHGGVHSKAVEGSKPLQATDPRAVVNEHSAFIRFTFLRR